MDDKFLYQLQEQPDSEFTKNLYKKLSQEQAGPHRWMNMYSHSLIRVNLPMLIITFLVISLLAIMTISPVRAYISSLILDIAGQSFEVTDDYPGDNFPGDEEIIEPQILPLGEALALFPYSVNLPTYIPDEYVLHQNARVYVGDSGGPFANTIEMDWQSSGRMSYILTIRDRDVRNREIIAPDSSIEEIMLGNGYPAVLIRGGWDYNTQSWSTVIGMYRLKWIMDNLTYDLMGDNREQLIEIALSTLD